MAHQFSISARARVQRLAATKLFIGVQRRNSCNLQCTYIRVTILAVLVTMLKMLGDTLPYIKAMQNSYVQWNHDHWTEFFTLSLGP